MLVRVDGVAVSSAVVRNTDLTDYTFSVPTLRPGTSIEVEIVNPATVNGEVRELGVAYLLSGRTVLRNGSTLSPTEAPSAANRNVMMAGTRGHHRT